MKRSHGRSLGTVTFHVHIRIKRTYLDFVSNNYFQTITGRSEKISKNNKHYFSCRIFSFSNIVTLISRSISSREWYSSIFLVQICLGNWENISKTKIHRLTTMGTKITSNNMASREEGKFSNNGNTNLINFLLSLTKFDISLYTLVNLPRVLNARFPKHTRNIIGRCCSILAEPARKIPAAKLSILQKLQDVEFVVRKDHQFDIKNAYEKNFKLLDRKFNFRIKLAIEISIHLLL